MIVSELEYGQGSKLQPLVILNSALNQITILNRFLVLVSNSITLLDNVRLA